jgi:hypothetical protein
MPRSPQVVARAKLRSALKVEDRAVVAKQLATTAREAAMIAAVEAGISRYEVGKICRGITGQRVSQIPGMPPGENMNPKAVKAAVAKAKRARAKEAV